MSCSPLARNQCAICNKVFARAEHLHRHKAVHSETRPFACRDCDKKFSRKDALHRHEQTRHPQSDRNERLPAMRRACLACSAARISCSGRHPCANCEFHARQCVYVRRKRTRTPLAVSTAPTPPSAQAGTVQEPDDDETGIASGVGAASGCNVDDLQATTAAHGAVLPDLRWGRSHAKATPINWLPLDTMAGVEHAQASPPSDSLSTTKNIHPPDGAVIVTQNTDGDGQTPSPRLDSLKTLIASMGRASRAFGNGLPVELLSQDGKPLDAAGALYSAGAGGRSSKSERAMHRRAHRQGPHPADQIGDVTSPGTECSWLQRLERNLRSASRADNSQLYHIPAEVYSDITAKVDARVPFRSTSSSFLFSSRNFLAKSTLDHFVRLYFDHFHPIYPFLDLPLLNMPVWGWSLCLATASVGCHYFNDPDKNSCADALSVLLRECLLNELQLDRGELTLSYLQALLLNTLTLCQSENDSVVALGEEAVGSVMHSCIRFCLFDEPGTDIEKGLQICDENQIWTAWRCREMWRRTGFFAWILDCTLSFVRMAPPVFSLQTLDLTLPSDEKLWEAASAEAWHEARRHDARPQPDCSAFYTEERCRPSLQAVVAHLYRKLELVGNLSQFATVGCIYALFHQHWDMIRQSQGPFSSLDSHLFTNAFCGLLANSYPARNPDTERWRNKACDYMDILHWEALGNSARAGGLEGPVFLQLHLGRLLILTPTKELLMLAEERVPDRLSTLLPHNVIPKKKDYKRCQQVVSTWARQDKYKARLAVVHAGATFWHVRRYATDSIAQSFAVYLAAITLYAFARVSVSERSKSDISVDTSTMAGMWNPVSGEIEETDADDAVSSERSNSSHRVQCNGHTDLSNDCSQRGRSSRMPAYYYVDRPVDDEMVQHFVRSGETKTTLCAEGIADLCTTEGVKQILLEAATLMRTGNPVWPVASKYVSVLQAIATETQDNAVGEGTF